MSTPVALAVDASNDLYVANTTPNNVTEYASPYTGRSSSGNLEWRERPCRSGVRSRRQPFYRKLQPGHRDRIRAAVHGRTNDDDLGRHGRPDGLAFDSSVDLFVCNYNISNVGEYTFPYSSGPTIVIVNGVSGCGALAMSSAGDLFVANYNNNSVTEYAPPYTGAPIATITNGVNQPDALAFDLHGDLFISNNGNNTVTEYAAPYTGAPFATISNGIMSPDGLAITK